MYTHTHAHRFVHRAMLLTAYHGRNSRVLGQSKMHHRDIALRKLTLPLPGDTGTLFTTNSQRRVIEQQCCSSSLREPPPPLKKLSSSNTIIFSSTLKHALGCLMLVLYVQPFVRSGCSSPVWSAGDSFISGCSSGFRLKQASWSLIRNSFWSRAKE